MPMYLDTSMTQKSHLVEKKAEQMQTTKYKNIKECPVPILKSYISKGKK